jgi:hypothetical protein
MTDEAPQTPFQSELIDHPDIASDMSRFQQLRNRPEFVVKELRYETLHDNQRLQNSGETERDYMVRQAGYGRQLLREFSELSGINIPKSQLLIGSNEHGSEVLYRVGEQVMGSDLTDAIKNGELDDDELSHLAASLFNYYKDKFETGEDYSVDLAWVGQYRYGRTLSDPVNRLYFTDTDPYYGRGEVSKNATAEDEYDYSIEDMIANVPALLSEISLIRQHDVAPEVEADISSFMNQHGIYRHVEI